jgi:hypothetical protein
MHVASGKGTALLGETGHPGAAAASARPRSGHRTEPEADSAGRKRDLDNAIPPDAERFMAERMSATTKSIAGSHSAFIAQPVAVAGFITEALAAA